MHETPRSIHWFAAGLLALGLATVAEGQVRFVRIGDIDGFGLGDGAGLLNADAEPCNVDGIGVLVTDDYIPDWNQDGTTMHFSGDDFDLRSPMEIAGTRVATSGFVDLASAGAEYTDLTLSRSYDETFPRPNDFPDPPSTDRNDAVFRFEVQIDAGSINPCTEVYFNIVFADIGGGQDSDLVLTFADRTMLTESIPPINPNVNDGQIRSAFLQLDFDSVFTLNGGVYDGFVIAELVTLPGPGGGDPYYAVDFAELSTLTIASCFGDVNIDAVVDINDLLELLAAWGPCTDPCNPTCRSDLIENGAVDIEDLLILLQAWGPC